MLVLNWIMYVTDDRPYMMILDLLDLIWLDLIWYRPNEGAEMTHTAPPPRPHFA